jgi:hypothetical protein
VNHAVLAKQFAGFTPLTANAMQQTILERFFVGQDPTLVPDTDKPMPATVKERHSFTKLPIPVEGFLNGLFHGTDSFLFSNESI